MATINQKLGEKIKKLRKKACITQERLSELSRTDYSYLNQIENGKRNPSIKQIVKIARVLKVKLSELTDF